MRGASTFFTQKKLTVNILPSRYLIHRLGQCFISRYTVKFFPVSGDDLHEGQNVPSYIFFYYTPIK